MHDRLQAIARATVLGAVVFSPWLIGSAEPWAYLLVSYLVAAGVGAWLLSLVCAEQPKVRAPLLTLALVVLLCFVAFQMLPLPDGVVQGLSPLAAEAQSARHELFSATGMDAFLGADAAAGAGLATLSASAAATRTSFWLLAVYIGAFLVLANTLTDWRQLGRAAGVVVVSSGLMVVFALVQKFSGATELYWFHRPRFGGRIFGPFTNRNHFASHIIMAFGVAVGLLLMLLRKAKGPVRPTWRNRLGWLATREASLILLVGFAALLMAATVFATLSRGAVVSLIVAAVVMGTVLAASRAAPRMGRVLAVGAVLVVVVAAWLAWGPLVDRLGTLGDVARDPLHNPRTLATADTLRIFDSSPLLGCGFGSFQHVFPMFQSPAIDSGRWLHAHNDYAELLAEGGLVGTGLVIAVAVIFALTLRTRLPKVSTRTKLFVAGLGVGLVAVALHSLVDYSLHKPANALFLAAVGAMAISAAHHARRRKAPRAWRAAVRVAAVCGLAVLAVLMARDPAELRGELAFVSFCRLERQVGNARTPEALNEGVAVAAGEAARVIRLVPRNPDALCEVAAACVRWSVQPCIDPRVRLQLGERAVTAAALAAEAAPSDYEPWLLLARAQAGMGLAPQAERCRTHAFRLAPPAVRDEMLSSRPLGGPQDGQSVATATAESDSGT